MKRILLLLCVCGMVRLVHAQTFSEWFEDRTLRLDYIFAGTNREQHIFFEQAYASPQWAGRRARLTEMPLHGNGQIRLKDHETGRLLYVHTFSTLFQEWQATEEATRVQRAFQTTYNVPMPLKAVDVTVTLTDFHAKVVCEMTHTIDPKDILIRQAHAGAVPFRYVWKGSTAVAPGSFPADAPCTAVAPGSFPADAPCTAVAPGGSPAGNPDIARCIDLAILAEGYTHGQMDKFYKDCQRVVDALFAHEPFASLKSRFNVVAVAAESPDAGPSVPHLGRWSCTPAGTHYDTFYSDRYLMTQDIHRIYDLLSGIPFEHVIVLVNSDTYGGGGIYNQLTVTTSDHPTFAQVLVHEFGHAYGGLGDEYYYDDAYETMYPSDTEPWEPNLTTLVDFASKWEDMLPKNTPVPTPPAKIPYFRDVKTEQERRQLNAATQRVGVFEGGGYQSKGVYRPAQECRMKINEVQDFCPVCSRALMRITDFYTSQ